MNRQELWEDCFRSLVNSIYSNSHMTRIAYTSEKFKNAPRMYVLDLAKQIANSMVDEIMIHRDHENNPKEKKS
ncbi:MAG: hypothetical protein PHC68_09180 [Syntrophorhabdaceae bacterium]|nr:hypothetical protein [Syntrophorhabdaceae bacterium]